MAQRGGEERRRRVKSDEKRHSPRQDRQTHTGLLSVGTMDRVIFSGTKERGKSSKRSKHLSLPVSRGHVTPLTLPDWAALFLGSLSFLLLLFSPLPLLVPQFHLHLISAQPHPTLPWSPLSHLVLTVLFQLLSLRQINPSPKKHPAFQTRAKATAAATTAITATATQKQHSNINNSSNGNSVLKPS